VLSEIIKWYVYNSNYKFTYNKHNIQETIRNGNIRDSECGEIIILRILYEELDDDAFAELCEKLGGHKIFEIVSSIDDQAGGFLDTSELLVVYLHHQPK
jgi:hypothetical protein